MFTKEQTKAIQEVGNIIVSAGAGSGKTLVLSERVLHFIKEKNYKIHLITNGFLEVQSIKMQASGLDKMIDSSFISEVVGFKKPDHRIFFHAMNEVGGNIENSVMIGDDLSVDIIPAKEIGMKHIYFNRKKISHNEMLDYEIEDLIEIKEIL